ncbi:hypothetical protein J6590_098964, partial [Homalodisca vitripennis]
MPLLQKRNLRGTHCEASPARPPQPAFISYTIAWLSHSWMIWTLIHASDNGKSPAGIPRIRMEIIMRQKDGLILHFPIELLQRNTQEVNNFEYLDGFQIIHAHAQ